MLAGGRGGAVLDETEERRVVALLAEVRRERLEVEAEPLGRVPIAPGVLADHHVLPRAGHHPPQRLPAPLGVLALPVELAHHTPRKVNPVNLLTRLT
jgi:hypothetical protein